MNVDEFTRFAKTAYNPPKNQFNSVEIPKLRYLLIDGKGNPENHDFPSIIKWFYSVVHATKPYTKKVMGKNFAYPPSEFLFWSKNEKDFISGNKDRWLWRAMVLCADFIPAEVIKEAMDEVTQKIGPAPGKAKLDYISEGKCIQYLHVGNYEAIPTICDELYGQYLPNKLLSPNGAYHEIYLGDPSRTDPNKRKILIRQPVKSVA